MNENVKHLRKYLEIAEDIGCEKNLFKKNWYSTFK